jgi:hypothetical protein
LKHNRTLPASPAARGKRGRSEKCPIRSKRDAIHRRPSTGLVVAACSNAEDNAYTIDGISVSDFVYPTWFEPGAKAKATQFDYLKRIKKLLECVSVDTVTVYDIRVANGFRFSGPDTSTFWGYRWRVWHNGRERLQHGFKATPVSAAPEPGTLVLLTSALVAVLSVYSRFAIRRARPGGVHK